MILTEREKDRVTALVLRTYRGARAVRIGTHRVEVKLCVQYDPAGRPLLFNWFECGTPEYWQARIQIGEYINSEPPKVFPPM